MTRVCDQDPASGCIICPGVEGSPGVPAHYEPVNVFGWDAGARSYREVNGDLYLQYEIPRPVGGAVCGIAPVSNYVVGPPSYVAHGVYAFNVMGVPFWSLWEYRLIGSVFPWDTDPEAVLSVRITRVGSTVYYRVSDGTTIWNGTFTGASTGLQLTLGCLYASGDQIV